MGSFSPAFLQRLRERTVLSELMPASVRLTPHGKEKTGLCPFHQEKTPSFTVNDTKGMYYCFGCGAHGDAISFLRTSQNLTFVETIEHLAQRVGMEIEYSQAPTPQAHGKQDLYRILEVACQYFQNQLNALPGERARAYLTRRGVTQGSVQRFRLGFSPSSKTGLHLYLKQQGFGLEDMLKAGLVGRSQLDGQIYDRFRGRLMFPILDTQGRVIAFGGRLLIPDSKAPKYLNSPETELFSKKQAVYGLYQIHQETALKTKPLVWVEGYMDTISLHQAGLARAIAPLGTALTEEQILRGWKVDPEPLVCLDGDASGRQAAFRLTQRVMPLLKPGYSLRFVRLPEGEDPDSLLATNRGAMLEDRLQHPISLMDFLWDYQVQTLPSHTPEQQALLFQKTKELAYAIQDSSVKTLYLGAIQQKWRQLLQQMRGFKDRSFQGKPSKNKMLQRPLFDSSHIQRKILLATLLCHPCLLEEFGETLATLEFPEPGFGDLRDGLLDWLGASVNKNEEKKESQYLQERLRAQGLAEVMQRVLTPDLYVHAAFCKPDSPLDQVQQGWLDVLEQYQRQGAIKKEVEATRTVLGNSMSEVDWNRLRTLQASVCA